MSAALTPRWLQALSLVGREAPDFYRLGDPVVDVPHAAAIRLALEEIGASAIHCIQGVPTIAFAVLEREDQAEVDRIHADLWNQGLMSLLLVIVGEQLQAFTLTRKPIDPGRRPEVGNGRDARLLDTFDLLNDALALRDFVTGIESGRLFREHYQSIFDARERVDGVLLDNLIVSHRRLLAAGLDEHASQALLMQAMFIAYLEDRGIISGSYFQEATGQCEIDGFRALLRSRRPESLRRLFLPLYEHFNGDLFHSPCAFGAQPTSCALTPEYLEILDDFIWGEWELVGKQKRFWSYRFRYIPVDLISAVYDRMLAENAKRKKAEGAYYTPMFLADLVVDQAWGQLGEAQRHTPKILDPACGSGVFLVRFFERLVEYRRSRSGRPLPWHSLKALVSRLHGWDKNSMAARIAVFSLYLALLEQKRPKEIRQLMTEGKMLPVLWSNNIKSVDFFSQAPESQFDLIIGNPPWNSREHKLPEAIAWCQAHGFPIPQEQSAWGFVWKARAHVREEGWIALLLPAMGFLHNDASLKARRRWLNESRMERLINFADMRHLLFENAKPAAIFALFRGERDEQRDYRFDYWCPKSDLNIQTRRLLTLSRVDQSRIALSQVLLEADVFKQHLWMGGVEAKLHDYLASFRRLGQFVSRYKDIKKENVDLSQHWVMGQGFAAANPDRLDDPDYTRRDCPIVARIPFLDATSFSPWILPRIEGPAWPTSIVHRERFSHGFLGPHILIPQVVRFDGRLRAAYDDQDLSFFHSIQAITFPVDAMERAKLIAAVLNSRLMGWFMLHETSAVGIEIPKIHEDECLSAPIPTPDDMEDPDQSRTAMREITSIMDDLLARRDRLLDANHWPETIRRLDRLVYTYYGLNDDEVAIIEETFDEIIPAIQPNKSKRPRLWQDSTAVDQARYLKELETSLGAWMKPETELHAEVLASSADAAIVRVHLGERVVSEFAGADWSTVLERLWRQLDRPVSRNLQVISDLRLYDGDDLYLFKPRKRRFWLRTTAMNDAAAIAGELFAE